MALRTISVVLILLPAIIASSAPARAQQPLVGVDGCTILASVVYTEVTEARLGYSTGLNGNPLYAGRGEISLCNHATRSITSAFATALRHTNIHVTWGFHTGYSGDYCLSHLLSQCYPRGNRAMPELSKSDRSFVMRSWQAVHDSVEYRMARYPGSDVARFQADELRRSIRRSILAGSIENQLHHHAH